MPTSKRPAAKAVKNRQISPSSSLSPDPESKGETNPTFTKVIVTEEVKVDIKPEENIEFNGSTPSKRRGRAVPRVSMKEESDSEEEIKSTPAKKPRANATKTKAKAKEEDSEDNEPEAPKAKKPRTSKVKAKKDEDADGIEKPKKVPKGSIFPPPEMDPVDHPPRAGYPIYTLSEATAPANGNTMPPGNRPMMLGAHVSAAGGVVTALLRSGKAGANGLAMFVKNQRSWKSAPFEAEQVERFKQYMKPIDQGGMGYPADAILVHGSYLINLGNPDPAKWNTSYECFKDDLERCNQLGIKLYNWHPGSTVGQCTKEESFALIAKAINKAHKEVPNVICVIENMANANSNVIGTKFEDLAAIINMVEDRSRVRVCIDTCHSFAAGYDLRTPEAYKETMRKFDEIVGNKYLGGMHLNDSKTDLGSCRDLHENIGLGFIGLSAFRQIMRDPLMTDIPLILETPAPDKPVDYSPLDIYIHEINMLYEIQKIEDDEWVTKESEIKERWRKLRDLIDPPKEPEEKGGKGKGKKKDVKPAKKGGKKKKVEEGVEKGCDSHDDE